MPPCPFAEKSGMKPNGTKARSTNKASATRQVKITHCSFLLWWRDTADIKRSAIREAGAIYRKRGGPHASTQTGPAAEIFPSAAGPLIGNARFWKMPIGLLFEMEFFNSVAGSQL